MIRFFNTLTGKLEPFEPLQPGLVKMYTCGPTVYDYAHIGNFRAFVFEDLLRRFLILEGFKVHHVMNLTDVDDKTIAGALREGTPLEDYTARYVEAFHEDCRALGILAPQDEPRAAREIEPPGGMIELIEKLLRKGAAYESGGSVYYRIAGFPAYGRLSKKKLEANLAGASVDVDEYEKEEGADFALWKKAKDGEPSWNSPWGPGRPGWHIECSAMSMKYLGETLDIHAGGEDLVFPHHENEIAQSEAATGKPFVRVWLHCKFLLADGEKMSKSKGNFYTLRDLLARGHDPAAIRYALLSTHYRTPLNFTLDGLKEAAEVIRKIDDAYFQCLSQRLLPPSSPSERSKVELAPGLREILERVVAALEDDLNVSAALAEFFEGLKEINRATSQRALDYKNLQAAIHFFNQADNLFGFDLPQIQAVPKDVEALFLERAGLRLAQEFKKDKALQARSDEIRLKLGETGWLVKDARPGEPSTIKKKRRKWD